MSLQNLFFSITAQPNRIEASNNEPTLAWGSAAILILFFQAQWAPGLLALQIMALVLWLTTPYIKRTKRLMQRALIALACAPLAPLLLASLQGPTLVFLVFVAVAAYTIKMVMLPREEDSPPLRPARINPGESPENLRQLRRATRGIIVGVGPKIGTIRGQEIPEWFINEEGQCYVFSHICSGPSIPVLASNETLVPPGLIFVLDESPQASVETNTTA